MIELIIEVGDTFYYFTNFRINFRNPFINIVKFNKMNYRQLNIISLRKIICGAIIDVFNIWLHQSDMMQKINPSKNI